MAKLSELQPRLPASTTGRVEIDISDLMGEEAGTTVFVLEEPDVPKLFAAADDGKKLARMFPTITVSLGTTAALLALSHVEPAADIPTGQFYAGMAVSSRDIFMRLVNKFMEAFPHLRDLEAAIADAKKPSCVD